MPIQVILYFTSKQFIPIAVALYSENERCLELKKDFKRGSCRTIREKGFTFEDETYSIVAEEHWVRESRNCPL
jgi:hypothetical protein